MTLLIEEFAWERPESVFAALAGEPNIAFLDSASAPGPRANASYICLDPLAILRWRENEPGDPFALLSSLLGQVREVPATPLPFSGGIVGLLGYELGRSIEILPSRHSALTDVPDLWAGLYDTVLAFDHDARRAWFMGWDRSCGPATTRWTSLRARLFGLLMRPTSGDQGLLPLLATWSSEMRREIYLSRVRRVKEYIRAGDIFQANFTTRFLAQRPESLCPIGLYQNLRKLSPAPFASYLDLGDGAMLIGASPERFLKLDAEGWIESRPIKGTRPRFSDLGRDRAAANALSVSEKDRAENLMIVDLMRNDIGRVARIGSVTVPELFAIESFSAVHHMVSAVRAQLRPEHDAVALLRACFPGGSVTGAPKIRAMQIIDEVETARRGPYCGAVVWIGFDGAMDSAIVIRSIVVTPTHLIAQAGGAIVADSQPEEEFAEMQVKVAALLGATDSSRNFAEMANG